MSSPLDLTENGPENSAQPSTTTRRAKRHHVADNRMIASQQSDLSTSTPRRVVTYLGDFALVLLFNIIMAFFGAIAKVFMSMTGNVGNYFTSEQENELLHDMPIEQRQQKRELAYLKGNQEQQNVQLDDLRRRVQKLEERRKAREKQS